jgi:RecB family exonuclease
MKRTLYLSSIPQPLLQQLANRPHFRALAPTPQAARALQVPHQNLEALTQKWVRTNGLIVASPLTAYRTLRNAVREVINPLDIEGTARALTPALKAILRAGVDLEALKNFLGERVQQLARLADAYQVGLRTLGAIDPAEIFWQATRCQPERQSIFVYGYFHPRRDELTFLNAVAGEGSVMILPCAEEDIFTSNREAISWLQQQGWVVDEFKIQNSDFKRKIVGEPNTWSDRQLLGEQLSGCFLDGTAVPVGVSAHVYPNLEAEVRGVLAQVKNLLHEGVAANEIVLIARDDAFYGPTVIDIAWEYDLPVRALYGIPLRETRLGAWVQLLLEVIRDNFPFESTAKLLSHPMAGKLSANIWAEARKRHPSNRNDWQMLGVDLSLLDWPKRDRRAEWVQRLQDVLNTFELRRRGKRWAREIVAFYRVQEALVDLAKPETERISLEDFIQDVTDTLALLSVPAQPGRGGVELHTPLSLFGAHYRHVFVLGTAEGLLPAPIENDPVLDFHERKRLVRHGFPFETAAQSAQREAFSFWALLQVAGTTLTFSYPQLIGKEPSLPTPYLKRLGLEASPPPLLPIASLEEARRLYLRRDGLPDTQEPSFVLLSDSVFANAVRAWGIEQRRESPEPADEFDGVVGLAIDPTSRVFSASQLTTLGQCPFKWFAQQVLRLKELQEAESDLGYALKGQLYHRSLELALAPVTSAADLHLVGPEQLKMAFLQAEQDLEFPALSAWDVRRDEHLKVLSLNLTEPKFLEAGVEIVSLETEFKEAVWQGLRVKGQVDRIDRTPNGLALLDYKTSSTKPAGVKNALGKAELDIQLSIYMDVVGTLFPNETVTDAYYYSLKTRKPIKAKRDEAALAAFAERVKSHLEMGHYPVEPDIERHACRTCPFDLVCRKGTRLSRKQSLELQHESDD